MIRRTDNSEPKSSLNMRYNRLVGQPQHRRRVHRRLRENMGTLSEFQGIEVGSLACLSILKQHNERRTLDVHLINAAPFHAFPKSCEFEKTGIAKRLRMNVIAPAQTKGPRASYLFERKTDRYGSVRTTDICIPLV